MPIRILVVDDEPSIRELLAEYLRGRGLEVETVGDAETALERLADAPPDVVITDLKLPGLDGVEVVRAATGRPTPVPTVMMTGFATVESAIAALTSGAQDYLLKPFRLRELHAAVERALAGGRRAHAARWALSATALLARAETVGTGDEAEALPGALVALLAGMTGVDRVEVRDDAAPGAHALGARRYLTLAPEPAGASAYIRSVHLALTRHGR
jgi:DNA-binding response OmpR family regulator